MRRIRSAALASLALPLLAATQTTSSATGCTTLVPSGSIRPSVASGYALQVVATGLNDPRGIVLDRAGHLLVVESGAGSISRHTINDQNGCVSLSNATTVASGRALNHGIQLSADGNTLYASNASSVMQWSYNAATGTISDETVLVSGMNPTGHRTRTILLSSSAPGMLVVSYGSGPNLDIQAANVETGRSTVKAFNIESRRDGAYNYQSDGVLLGWGLRNSVGVAEHPFTGGIYTVENSADELSRDGVVVSENNPAEEMNFHGYLNGTEYARQGDNYGYPWCFAVWNRDDLPNNSNLNVGQQFAIARNQSLNNENRTDEYCSQQVGPRLSFQAHMAPLDLKFNNSGTEGWITFRGSWNREDPIGYKVSVIEFNNGEPTEPATSTNAVKDIVKNRDDSACPDDCFRPVAMAIDTQGRIFFSADASGEIYLITRTNAAAAVPPSAASWTFGSPSVGASMLAGLAFLVVILF